MIAIYLPQIIPAFLIGALPWLLVEKKQSFNVLNKKLFTEITLVYLALVMISLLPVAFVMSEMGPERAWTQVSLYTVIYACITGVFTGNLMQDRYNRGKLTMYFTVVAVAYILFTGIPAVKKASAYSKAYDARMAYILEKKQAYHEKILTVPPLPEPGWLHSAELDSNPDHFINRFLEEYLELSFDLQCEQPVIK